MNVISESFFVGIGLIILGLLIYWLIMTFVRKSTPSMTDALWMALVFFLSGFFFHIICQIVGINRWYCENGNACKK